MAIKVDQGVVLDGTNHDIIAVPTVTDIGVPVTYSLLTADNMPQGTTHTRDNVFPAVRTIAQRGIGVPYNPQNGVTST